MFKTNLLQANLELFSDQHRDRRVGALPHLDVRHRQDDLAVAADMNESVWCEVLRLGGLDSVKRQAEAQHKTTAETSATCQEATSRQICVSGTRGDAIEGH